MGSVKKKQVVTNPLTSARATSLMSPQGPNTWHNKWISFYRTYADTIDYTIGQITPDSWSVSGNNDKYTRLMNGNTI